MRADHDPLKELAAVQKRMNQLFESAMARTNFETSEGFDHWTPVCDVFEADESGVIEGASVVREGTTFPVTKRE